MPKKQTKVITMLSKQKNIKHQKNPKSFKRTKKNKKTTQQKGGNHHD